MNLAESEPPKYLVLDDIEIPESFRESWQITVNMLAEIASIPAALIMRVHAHEIEVFTSSQSPSNIYHQGEKLPLGMGRYCETVMSTRQKLLVPNALKDPHWDHNPSICLGIISYVGLPLFWPHGEIFGTICILDTKENSYTQQTHHLLDRFRDSVQLGLANIYEASQIHLQMAIAETSLRESEAKFHALFDSIPDSVFIMSSQGQFLDVNHTACERLGYSKSELLHMNAIDINTLECAEQIPAKIRELMEKGELVFESVHVRKNGLVVPIELSCRIINYDGKSVILGVARDITERKMMEERVRQLAHHDQLTQLPNRRLLDDRLQQAMLASKRSGRFGAVMFLDLDNFKSLNDAHGHDVGDLLLVEVAIRLTNAVREMDTIARFGGDEFVVLLSELDVGRKESVAQTTTVAEKIRGVLAEPYILTIMQEGETTIEHHCTATIGIVLFIGDGATKEEVLKWADTAMYQAKEIRRNSIRFYDPQQVKS